MQGIDLETTPVDWDDNATEVYRDELIDRHRRLVGPETEDEIDEVEGVLIATLCNANLSALPTDDAALLLRQYLRRAMAQAASLRLARFDGDYSDCISDTLFRFDQVASTPAPAVRARPIRDRVDLETVLIERWSVERKVSPKGIDKHKAAARWFAERTGIRDVGEITKADVLAFKDKMVGEGVSPANANAKLSCLRTLLSYAAQNGLTDKNAAEGVRVLDKDRERRKRKEFDLASLAAIFSSPVYSADERPTQGRGEAAYWLPLLALFTGARLEELAQLRSTDVRQETYLDGSDRKRTAWMIHIVQEDGLTTKNAGSERSVPVHPDLERLGFIRMAQQAAETGQRFLFPDLRSNKYGKRGAKWGEWWSRYRREVCGVTGPGLVFHSFRHGFKFYARHVGMIEGVQRQIMGHKPGDVAAEYGGGRYTVHQLVEGMKLFRVPGFKPPAPPPAFR
jgi:integrase